MNDLLTLVPAILTANILTAIFLLGMKRLWNVTDDKDVSLGAVMCAVVPLGVVALGFFLAH